MSQLQKSSIEYINPNAPEVSLPSCGGERYESLVPDTLDLQEMARNSDSRPGARLNGR